MRSECSARDVHALWPLTTQPSPRRSARVAIRVRVGARVALGHAERLQADLAARELRQPALLLRLGAVPQQRAHRVHLRVARARVAAGGVDLLEDDGRLLEPEAAAAVLGRDQDGEQAGGGHRLDERLGVAVGLEVAPVRAREVRADRAHRRAQAASRVGVAMLRIMAAGILRPCRDDAPPCRPLARPATSSTRSLPAATPSSSTSAAATASLVRHLARRGARAVGVEIGAEPLARARAHDPVAEASATSRAARRRSRSRTAPPTSSCSPTACTTCPATCSTARSREAARVLRPGGLLYVQEPVAEGPYFELLRPIDDETDVPRRRAGGDRPGRRARPAPRAGGALRLRRRAPGLRVVPRPRRARRRGRAEAFEGIEDDLRERFEATAEPRRRRVPLPPADARRRAAARGLTIAVGRRAARPGSRRAARRARAAPSGDDLRRSRRAGCRFVRRLRRDRRGARRRRAVPGPAARRGRAPRAAARAATARPRPPRTAPSRARPRPASAPSARPARARRPKRGRPVARPPSGPRRGSLPRRRPARRPAPGRTAPDPCAAHAAITRVGPTGRPNASRKQAAAPRRRSRAPTWNGSTWPAHRRGCAMIATPRATSRARRRIRPHREASSTTSGTRTTAAASSSTDGRCSVLTPSCTATTATQQAAQGLERSLGGERSRQRGPGRVAQVALGERDADGVAAARRQHPAEPRAADVPGARPPAGDRGPGRRQHAAPGEPARRLRCDVKRDRGDEQAGMGAGDSVDQAVRGAARDSGRSEHARHATRPADGLRRRRCGLRRRRATGPAGCTGPAPFIRSCAPIVASVQPE